MVATAPPCSYGYGKLRYYGIHYGRQQECAGIELDAPRGTHDGQDMGFRYFTCPAARGVLVDPREVIPVREKPPDPSRVRQRAVPPACLGRLREPCRVWRGVKWRQVA